MNFHQSELLLIKDILRGNENTQNTIMQIALDEELFKIVSPSALEPWVYFIMKEETRATLAATQISRSWIKHLCGIFVLDLTLKMRLMLIFF